MLMLCVLSYKTGNVVNSGTWLAKLPPRAQQSHDSFLILSSVLQGLHSRQAVRTLTVRAVLEAKSEAWLLTVRAG